MKLKRTLTTIFCATALISCGNLDQVVKTLEDLGQTTSLVPTDFEISNGLKQALSKGTEHGVNLLHKSGGYLNEPKVKIPFPQNLVKVENTIRNIGLGSQIDKVVTSLNHAAEDAVIEASPLFLNAIKEMSFQDVKNILFGEEMAATNYLKSKTSQGLETAFRPKIKLSLDKVNATKYWADVTGTYNKIPLVTKVDSDLPSYVTTNAIDGLFLKISEEEKAIRANPIERTTDLLKKVFSYADSQKN